MLWNYSKRQINKKMSNIEILNKHNFKFNKAYGQNFIFDKNFLRSIVEDIEDNSNILEIGPGAGTLTAILCEKAKNITCFEIDKNLQPILEENLQNFSNYKIVWGDILKFSMEEIERHFDGEYDMVANLPYYITTPIIFKFLENATRLRSMTIMVQYEVAERLVAKAGTKEYGAITPAIDYRANAKIIKKVNRNMFTPAPNVDSAIVRIDFVKNKFNIINTSILDDTIKAVFAMRRKTIENNLKSFFKLSGDIIKEILNEANISPSLRGEKLTTIELVNLSNIICKFIKK